jgi:hypothetical protein
LIKLSRSAERQNLTRQSFAPMSIASRRGETAHFTKPVTHVWSRRILFPPVMSRRKCLEAYLLYRGFLERLRSRPINDWIRCAAQSLDARYGPVDHAGELFPISIFPTFPQMLLCIRNRKPGTVSVGLFRFAEP